MFTFLFFLSFYCHVFLLHPPLSLSRKDFFMTAPIYMQGVNERINKGVNEEVNSKIFYVFIKIFDFTDQTFPPWEAIMASCK